MVIKILSLLFVAFSLTLSATAQLPGWKLVWSDEFNYTGSPDSTKWSYNVGGNGWGNGEKQMYIAHRLKNCRVENGKLIIEALKERVGDNAYTSARLVTQGKAEWTYGRIEVCAKIPAGRGSWPAIWLLRAAEPLKWPDDGEIDIMEHVGYDPGNIHATVHCARYNHLNGNQKTAITHVPDCNTTFHVYAVEWNSNIITAFVDGKKYFTYTNENTGKDAWPFNQPFYLILNIAVGGSWGGIKGIDDAAFPQRMEVEYVRVYKAI
jgi:beta-glucanase (GH16 family)